MSLQFLKIVLHNYGQFEHEEILFPEGISAFIGKNGTGKTTILDAIPFAFYGESPNQNMDDVMHFNAPPRSHCYVELYFILNDHRYKLVRDLKRTNNTYLELSNGTRIVTKKKDVTEHVKNKLLKMDYTTFCNAFYARQKEVAALTNMKPTERVETITKLLRFQAFDVASEIKKAEKKEIEEEIVRLKRDNINEDDANQRILDMQEQIKQIEEEILLNENQLKEEVTSYELLKKEKEIADLSFQSFVRMNESIESTKKQIQMNETRNLIPNEQRLTLLFQKQEKLKELEGSKEKVELYAKKRDEMLDLKGKYEQKVKIFRDLKNIKEAFDRDKEHSATLTKEIESSSGLKTNLEQMEKKKDYLQSELDKTRETIHQQEMEHRDLTGKVKDKNESKNKFLSLGKESPCPTCGQALGEKYDQEIDAINQFLTEAKPVWTKQKEEIDVLRKHFASLQTNQQTNDKELRTAQQKVIQFEKATANLQIVNAELKRKKQEFDARKVEYEEYKEVQFDQELMQKIETAYQTYQKNYNDYVTISAEVKQIPEIQDFVEETKSIITSLKEDLLKYEQQKKDLGFDLESYQQLGNRLDQMHHNITSKREHIHARKLDNKTIQQRIDELKEKLEQNKENNKKVVSLTKQSHLKDLLIKGYKECKRNILEEIAPILSGEMSQDIRTLTDGRYDYIELDSTFLPFMEKDGQLKPINFFSGGEESVLAISLRLAISKMLAESTGQELDFLALDEVFAYLDKDRIDNVARLLDDMSQHLSQIFIITHEDHIKDFATNTLEVRLTSKGSSTTKWLKKVGRASTDHQFEKVQQILDEYVVPVNA